MTKIKKSKAINSKNTTGITHRKLGAKKPANKNGLAGKLDPHKILALVFVMAFAGVGTYLLLQSRAAESTKLLWAPPSLTNPISINIDSTIITSRGTDGYRWNLDNTKDYEIKIGSVNTSYGVVISGGRNVVIKGGYITIPWAGNYPSNAAAYQDMAKRRALLIANQVGTVHIEGLLIDNAGGDLTEGIQIQSPGADVQIENVRITGVHARDEVGYSDNHPDCVQPLGLKALRIDRLTCGTDGQAMYIDNKDGPITSLEINHTNVWGTVNTYPYLYHRVVQDNTFPVILRDFWVKPQPGDTLYNSVANNLLIGGVYQNKYTATVATDGLTVSWPDDPSTNGFINAGAPNTGDYVIASAVGLNYISPGYVTDADLTVPSQPTNLTTPVQTSNSINLSWSPSTDNVGVTGYDVYRNSAKVSTIANTSYSDTGLSASTTYDYYVIARDAAGNSSLPSSTINATTQAATQPSADTAAPTVTITSPLNNTAIGNSVYINATITDNVAVTKREIWIDGKLMSTNVPYTWNSKKATRVSHTITVKAYDASGNIGQSSIIVYK